MPDKYGIPSPGDKVRFLAKNGYDHELGYAKTIFTEGQVLTVAKSDVHGWSSSLSFEGVTGQQTSFNCVMFELVRDQQIMNEALLFKNSDIYQQWAQRRRPGNQSLAAQLGPAEEIEFQAIGMTVMDMIDQIRETPGMSREQYGAMRHVIIQQLFDIWSLDRKVAV